MEMSNLGLMDMLEMTFKKILEMLNINNLNNIDFSRLTSQILSITFLVIVSIIFLWLIKAIGLYTMAKNSGDKYAFLAFIPYGCLYTNGIEINNAAILLPLLVLCMFLPFTKCLVSMLFIFAYFGVLYRLYQKQVPNYATVLLIFSVILPILQPFFIFFIRNAKNWGVISYTPTFFKTYCMDKNENHFYRVLFAFLQHQGEYLLPF